MALMMMAPVPGANINKENDVSRENRSGEAQAHSNFGEEDGSGQEGLPKYSCRPWVEVPQPTPVTGNPQHRAKT